MEYVTVTHRDELMTLASSGEKEMPAQVIYTTKELSLSHQSLLKNTACLRKASLDHMVEEIYSKIYSDIVEE